LRTEATARILDGAVRETMNAIASVLADVAAGFDIPLELDGDAVCDDAARVVIRVAVGDFAALEVSCDATLARDLSARVFQKPARQVSRTDERHVFLELARALAPRVRREELAGRAETRRPLLEMRFRSGRHALVVRLFLGHPMPAAMKPS
jgi:hypothetical protein